MAKELTRQAIISAFLKLLNDRPLDKISVKDIVAECEINRNTFYYHYQDIYALVEEIFATETKKVIEKNEEHFNWQEGLIQSTQFALQNKKAVYHIYNSVNRKDLERYLFQVAGYIMEQIVRHQAEDLKVTDEDILYISTFYKHALVGIIIEWLERGMVDEPESVIRRMGEIFEGNLRIILEKVSK